MSSISIETKKLTELTAIATPELTNILPIHDGSSLKTVTAEKLKSLITADVEEEVAPLIYNNAGAHNAIYRGKYLGNYLTDEQSAAITAGTFEDLYIGDYWTINSVNWRIAAFDYYYKCGDTSCTTHHVVIVPDTVLSTSQMNSSNTTEGGYVGSLMYTENLETVKEKIAAAFPDHVLSKRIYLTNAVTSGHPSAGAWCDSTVDLMNEQMVYGGAIFMPIADGSTVYTNHRVEKSQLPLFALNPSMIGIRTTWWLRDVVTAAYFASVGSNGHAAYDYATGSLGVRPAFCICQS